MSRPPGDRSENDCYSPHPQAGLKAWLLVTQAAGGARAHRHLPRGMGSFSQGLHTALVLAPALQGAPFTAGRLPVLPPNAGHALAPSCFLLGQHMHTLQFTVSPFLIVRFRGTECVHTAVQPSPPSLISRTSHLPKRRLHPQTPAPSPHPRPPASTLRSVSEFDVSGSLT